MREAAMHSLLLVTFSLPEGETAQEARRAVHDALLNDTSFCGEGGWFSTPLCDCFVIGGRWSGLLAETIIGSAYRDAVIAKFPEFAAEWLPNSVIANHGQELDALWREHGGTGPSPYTRDGYRDFEDDAMVITQKLYDALLAKYQGEDASSEFVDLDYESVRPDFVGRKWLVVVDYHN
jgi:hypothetical protein